MKTAQQVVQLAMMSHGYLSIEEILVSQHSSFTRRVVRCVNNSRFGMLRIAKVLRLLSLSVIYLTFISTITLLGVLSQYVNHFILLSNIDFLNFFFKIWPSSKATNEYKNKISIFFRVRVGLNLI